MNVLLALILIIFSSQLHAESMIRLVCIDNLKVESDSELPQGKMDFRRDIDKDKYGGLPELYLLRGQSPFAASHPVIRKANNCFLVTNKEHYKFLVKKSFYHQYVAGGLLGGSTYNVHDTYTWRITRDEKLYTAGEVDSLLNKKIEVLVEYFSSDEYVESIVQDQVQKELRKIRDQYRPVEN